MTAAKTKHDEMATGRFCWIDLAATDAARAKTFYEKVFGWTSREQPANGGTFTRLRLAGRDVGSVYQLRQVHIDEGVPSHWTPYVQVENMDDAVGRVIDSGGAIIVRPFDVSGIARIALVTDAVGARVGLWEPIGAGTENDNG